MATYAEAFSRMGETVLDTTKRIAEINVRAGQQLFEQQAELANQWINAMSRNVDLMSKAAGFPDVLSGQAQVVQEYNQQLLSTWRRSAEIIGEASHNIAETMGEATRSATQEARRQTSPQS